MFKRVEKRIRKKEKEEELGLNEEMKEMMGMHDTDSDESLDSDSDDNPESEASDGEVADGDASDDMEGGEEDEEDEEDEEEREQSEEEEEEDEPPMSISEALQSPLYHVSLEPEVKACIVCPRKLLKNPVMVDVHLKSGAHSRRFVHLREAAMGVSADTDVRDLVRAAQAANQAEKPIEGKLSKRAEKKKAKLAAIKARREKQKIMKAKYRAKKEAKAKVIQLTGNTSTADTASEERKSAKPPAKKRKVDHDVDTNAVSKVTSSAGVSQPSDKVVPTTEKKRPSNKPSNSVKQLRPQSKDGVATKLSSTKSKHPSTSTSGRRGAKGGSKTKKRRHGETAP